MKKIIILILFILSIGIVNADVTLNNCGSQTWTNGEFYLINITSEINSGTSCFTGFTDSNFVNLTFKQVSPQIVIDVSSKYSLFDAGKYINDSRFKDMNIDFVNSASTEFHFFDDTSLSLDDRHVVNNNFTNNTIRGMWYLQRQQGAGSDTAFDNNYFDGNYFVNFQALSRDSNSAQNNNFTNNFLYKGSVQNVIGTVGAKSNNWFEGGVIAGVVSVQEFSSGFTYNVTNSLVKGKLSNESADTRVTSRKQFVDLRLDRFLENYVFAYDDIVDNKNLIFIHDNQILTAVTPYSLGSVAGSSLQFFQQHQLQTATEISLFDNDFDCVILLGGCDMFVNSTTTLNSPWNGHITLIGGNTIDNIDVSIDSTSTDDVRIISTSSEFTTDAVIISNSEFTNSRTSGSDFGVNGGKEFIKLKTNNLRLQDNRFEFSGSNSNNHTALYIDSASPTSNLIYNNNFTDLRGSPTGTANIFNLEADARFYHNYIDSGVDYSIFNPPNLNVSPLITYQHSNGNIYEFRIGNYYVDNVGCVDGNADGICDSSYTTGFVTDDYPLATYPFDYEGNILFAETTITNSSFNIVLVEPVQNQTFNLASASETIDFTYNHDSPFTETFCNTIIDSSSVDESKVDSNTNKTLMINTWTAGTHTFRVECNDLNELSFEISDEISFEVTIAGVENGNETNDEGLVEGEGIDTLDIVDLDDISGSTDNVVEFADNVVSFFANILLPLVVIVAPIIILVVIMIIIT